MIKHVIAEGLRFGRLVAVCEAGYKRHGSAAWLCQCDCGQQTVVGRSQLGCGNTTSCGCIQREKLIARCTRHGHSKRGELTQTWNSWRGMVERCNNPGHIGYPRYGGRGITVCDRWRDFANFVADMGLRPNGTSIDRFPSNSGNYEPGNCRWATPKEQAANSTRWKAA